jgi:hypothetical protein
MLPQTELNSSTEVSCRGSERFVPPDLTRQSR